MRSSQPDPAARPLPGESQAGPGLMSGAYRGRALVGDILVVGRELLLAELMQRAVEDAYRPTGRWFFDQVDAALAHCLARPPALVFLDWELPEDGGRHFIRRARGADLTSPILVLAAVVDRALATELLSLGANRYVGRNGGLRTMEDAIRQLLQNPPRLPGGSGIPAAPRREPESLTTRQREVALAVARGHSSREIAEQLGLSPRTVETYRAQVLVKLRLPDTTSLVRWCVERRLA